MWCVAGGHVHYGRVMIDTFRLDLEFYGDTTDVLHEVGEGGVQIEELLKYLAYLVRLRHGCSLDVMTEL